MTTAQKSALNGYFKAVLPFCDKRKVTELLAALGYNASNITPNLCVTAYIEQGKDFFQPFGRIAGKAIESPKFEAYTKMLYGKKPVTKLNKSNDKAEMGLQYLGIFTNWFQMGKDIFHDTKYSETDKTKAAAELLAAQTAADKQNQESQKTWILPVCIGAGVLVLLLVIILVFKK